MARRNSIVTEYLAFMKHHKAYWLVPIVLVLLLLAVLLVFGGGAAAPFIYTLF